MSGEGGEGSAPQKRRRRGAEGGEGGGAVHSRSEDTGQVKEGQWVFTDADPRGRRIDKKLLHNGDVLEETRVIWQELTSKFIGENDLWLLTFWLRNGNLSFDRRKQAFSAGT